MIVTRQTVVAAACLPELGSWELLEGSTKRLRDNKTCLASLQGQCRSTWRQRSVSRDAGVYQGSVQASFNPLRWGISTRQMDRMVSRWLVLLSPDLALGTFHPQSVLTPYIQPRFHLYEWFLVLNTGMAVFSPIYLFLPEYSRGCLRRHTLAWTIALGRLRGSGTPAGISH